MQIVQVLAYGLLIGGIYALLASGVTLIFGVLDVVNVAQGAFLVFSALFTSPPQLSSPIQNCRITVTAEDADGVTSEASRWITIASSLVFEVSGTLFGTDGEPLANQEMTYRNWNCEALEASNTVSTDNNGAYLFEVDLNSCFEDNDYGYIDSGHLEFEYERNGHTWYSSSYLYGITDFYSPFNTCAINDNGVTVCEDFDIRLPTFWTNIFGTYIPENEIASLPEYANQYIDVFVTENTNVASTSHRRSINDVEILGSEFDYGPIEVPFVGDSWGNWLYIWDGTNWVDMAFNMLSLDGTRVDIAPNVAIPLQVTVNQPNDDNINFDNLTLAISLQAANYERQIVTLDANNQYFSELALGYGDLELKNSDQYLSYKSLRLQNLLEDEVIIDFFSTEECKIEGTFFDLSGNAMPNTDLVFTSVTGYFGNAISTATDELGRFSIQTSADQVWLNSVGGEFLVYSDDGIQIDNCRPTNGEPRVIRWDIQQPNIINNSVTSEIFE